VPTVPYLNTVRVVAHQSFYGEEATNVFHLRVGNASVLSAAVYADIAAAFEKYYINPSTGSSPNRGIGDARPTSAIFDKLTMYDLRTVPNPAPVEVSYAAAGSGTVGNSEFLDVAAVATLKTAVAGRSGRGRHYLGPLSGVKTSATASAPAMLAVNVSLIIRLAWLDLQHRVQLISAIAPANMAVLSVHDGLSRPITTVGVNLQPDTQRRRDLSAPYPAQPTTSLPIA